MCEFCEQKDFIKFHYLGVGYRTPLISTDFLDNGKLTDIKKRDCIFLEENRLGYDNSSGEYATQYIEINFCPFCGRRLNYELV